MRILIAAMLLAVCVIAWSADPVKESNKVNPSRGSQQPKAEQRGSEKAPVFVSGEITVRKDRTETDDERHERKAKTELDKALVEYTWWIAAFTLALFLAAAIQAGLFVWQLRLIKDGTKDAQAVAQAAQISAEAARKNADAVMLSERAYVKVTLSYPGVRWNNKHTGFFVDALVKNHGRTPAMISDVWIARSVREHGDLLPAHPIPESRESKPSGILVPSEDFSWEKYLGLTAADATEVQESSKRLWIYGHVDYIDTFGKRHRAGFARMYEPALEGRTDGSNLILNTEFRYDYDRERRRGEGGDWGALSEMEKQEAT